MRRLDGGCGGSGGEGESNRLQGVSVGDDSEVVDGLPEERRRVR